MAVVSPTGRSTSVRNRCVIEHFGGVFVLLLCFLEFSMGVRIFVIGPFSLLLTLIVVGRVFHVESKHRTRASLCYLPNIDKFQYVLLHNSTTYTNVYIGIGSI